LEDIGFIIINFNTSEYTINCVESIQKYTSSKLKYKIIIIDNNSACDDYLKLKRLEVHNNIIILRNDKNIGFAGANMIGINYCDPKYFYFLNNDTLLLNDCASILFEFMEFNPKAGICSGQMYDESGGLGINFNYFPNLKLKLFGSNVLRIFNPENYPKKGIEYTHPVQVQVLNGSSLFTRAELFNNIGGFDTSMFLYCEEEDICLRVKDVAYTCYLEPKAKYVHYSGKSSSKGINTDFDLLKEFYISQHILYRKHFGRMASYIWRITQFVRSLRKFYKNSLYVSLAFFILKGADINESLRYKQLPNPC
jgi:GT2 family glycosyltransferase